MHLKLTFDPSTQLVIISADSLLDVHVILMTVMYNVRKWLPRSIRRNIHRLQFIFKCAHLDYPYYLQQFLAPCSVHRLRHSAQYFFSIPTVRKVTVGGWGGGGGENLCIRLPWIGIIYLDMFKNSFLSHFETNCTCFG